LLTHFISLNSDHGQVSGKVLVYKHPGLHFGDIHVLTATYIDGLEKVVGNSKYAIFFPTSGPRSLADEIANSDFDGDMYWVSRNPQVGILVVYFLYYNVVHSCPCHCAPPECTLAATILFLFYQSDCQARIMLPFVFGSSFLPTISIASLCCSSISCFEVRYSIFIMGTNVVMFSPK
jgi:hypothetical protein